MSEYIQFIFDCPIICKRVKYIDQSDNSSQCLFGFYTSRFGRLVIELLLKV